MKWIALLAFSQVADLASTAFSISRGAHELNPLIRVLVENGGLATILLAKSAVIIFAAYLTIRAARLGLRYVRFTNGVVVGLSVLAFMVATLNMVSWI